MTDAVAPHRLTAAEEALVPPHARQPRVRRRLVLTVLAAVVFVAALLDPEFGMLGLIPFGLLLAFSTGSDEEELAGRSSSRDAISGWPPPWWRPSAGSGCGTSIWPSRRSWRSPVR